MPRDFTRFRPRQHSQRGSLLIVAMLLAAIVGVALTSYLRLSRTSLEVAGRSFLHNAAVNLAETGLEYALHSLNQHQSGGVPLATAWSGWSTDNTAHTAVRLFPATGYYEPVPNARGTVRVFVSNYDVVAGAPVLIAKATITPGNSSQAVVKYLQVTLSRRSLWGFGLVGKTWVHLNSNARVDSWISDPDANPATAALAYVAGLRRDNGSVGTVSPTNGALALDSNAEVFGTANTGGGTVATNSNVRIFGATSPGSPKVDPSRVHTDFKFTFPPIAVPNPATINLLTSSISGNTTLPAATHLKNTADNKYYYRFGGGTNINMDSNKTLTITDSVVLLFESHAGVPTIHTSSNANFNVTAGKTVEIYTNGNIALDSNNNLNIGNEAKNLRIFGTSTTSQSFVLSSNVNIYGCIYAPFAAFAIDSNCKLQGSVIANTIQMDSNAVFHYDESLGNLGGSGGFRVSRWRELRTPAERSSSPAGPSF